MVIMILHLALIVGRSSGVAADLFVAIITWRRAMPMNVGADFKFALASVLFNDGMYIASLPSPLLTGFRLQESRISCESSLGENVEVAQPN